jgi:hypothetical protein
MTGRQRDLEIARILDELSTEIEELGAALCADPVFCDRHIESLQAIDLIAQNQRWLAELLRADCHDTAVHGIGVEALQARFRQDQSGSLHLPGN